MELMQELEQSLNTQEDYIFNTDKITFSTINIKGEAQSFVTGYISVPEIDLYNDLVTPLALKSMLRQITESNIVLDYEHESFRDDKTILPVGKIVEAKVDDRGLWVKAVLNKHSPKYKALWGSVKDGFINAFSIAFKPLKVVTKTVGDVTVRLIEDLKLLNVALTGTPVNEGAIMTSHSMKSVFLKAIGDTTEEKILVNKSLITKLMEDKNMETKDEVIEKTPEESESTEVESTEKVEEPESSEEPATEPVEAEEEESVEAKALAELKANVKKLSDENLELKSDLKALKKSEVFKSTVSNKPELKSEPIQMLGLIR